MIERVFSFTKGEVSGKLVEEIIHDPDLNLTRIIVPPGGGFFNESTTSNDYLVVVRGEISLKLGSQNPSIYSSGTVIAVVPYVQIEIENPAPEELEFLLLKAPSPERFETIRALEQDSSYLTFCTYILYSCKVLGSSPSPQHLSQNIHPQIPNQE